VGVGKREFGGSIPQVDGQELSRRYCGTFAALYSKKALYKHGRYKLGKG